MKEYLKWFYIFCLYFLTVGLQGCSSQQSIKPQRVQNHANRVLIIGLDGLAVKGLTTAKTPNLDKLFKDGSMSLTTRAVMPSVTLPNWTSHLTSSGPEQQGISSNEWTLENHELNPIESDDEGYPISVFKILKENISDFKTAYYYNWGNLINPINHKYLDDVNFLEDDAYVANYEKATSFLDKNRNNPSLVFLYNVATDHAGHKHGWMSDPYIKVIEDSDRAIGKLIFELRKKNLFENTYFILITDHGGASKGHGGMSSQEMIVPWGIRGPGIKRQIMTEPNSNADTGRTILKLFGQENEVPDSWIGKTPYSIFKTVKTSKAKNNEVFQ